MALRDFFAKKPPSGEHLPPPGDVLLFSTLSGKKEHFSPVHPREMRMYNCGPTVYGPAHIGNLRSYVFADTIRRTFRQAGYDVKQVINITDVGHLTSDADDGKDKIEEGAKREGLSAREIANRYTEEFREDIAALNIGTEDVFFPRASDHIGDQIALIKTLEEKGFVYRTADGLYFDTSMFPRYGVLGGIDLHGLKEGARVEKNVEKRHPTDFALWKLSPAGEKRQQEWASPWGTGFPGWHIECSAMSMRYLGKTFDIHTGGIDHIPIHHNNEIAQSEAATGRTYARYWMHNEFVMVEGRKISKSLGNTITLSQLKDRNVPALAYRLFLLGAHYRTLVNFTWEAAEGAAAALFRLKKLYVEKLSKAPAGDPDPALLGQFRERMNDDLDTPRALALLWETAKNESLTSPVKRATILAMDAWLGLGIEESDDAVRDMLGERIEPDTLPDDIKDLLKERAEVREKKDYARADAIRDELIAKGYSITDGPNGPEIYSRT